MKRLRSLVGLFVLLLISPSGLLAATAAKPLLVCLAPSGSIAAKTKCAKNEVRLTANNLAASISAPMGPTGPAGAPGAKGSDGVVNPNRCVTRSQTYSGYDYIMGRASCFQNEFLLTHGVVTSTVNNDVVSISLLYYPGQSYPTGVDYETGVNSTSDGGSLYYTITVSAVCCTP